MSNQVKNTEIENYTESERNMYWWGLFNIKHDVLRMIDESGVPYDPSHPLHVLGHAVASMDITKMANEHTGR